MDKKWLYSVALGALLMAGNAAGITVHEVLSHDFWSTDVEQRLTAEQLTEISDWDDKPGKIKEKDNADGTRKCFLKSVRLGKTAENTQWKSKEIYNSFYSTAELDEKREKIFVVRHKTNKEKTITNENFEAQITAGNVIASHSDIQEVYKNIPNKKDALPAGSYVVEDWFRSWLENRVGRSRAQFYGTEHSAVTNIISDNEAYITGTISQAGHIDKYDGYVVDEDASLLRTYTQHITTDADHVYVEQEITEDAKNAVWCNRKNTYQRQYTATFKKGRWKGETETITVTQNSQAADWYLKYLDQNSR